MVHEYHLVLLQNGNKYYINTQIINFINIITKVIFLLSNNHTFFLPKIFTLTSLYFSLLMYELIKNSCFTQQTACLESIHMIFIMQTYFGIVCSFSFCIITQRWESWFCASSNSFYILFGQQVLCNHLYSLFYLKTYIFSVM